MFNCVWKQREFFIFAILIMAIVGSPMTLAATGIQWEKSIEKGLAEAKSAGKPVMMEFYTDW